jgi:hypothetical protein
MVDRWEFDDRINWLMPRMMRDSGDEMTFEELKAYRLGFRKRMCEKPGTIWQMNDDLRRAGSGTWTVYGRTSALPSW